MPTISLWAYPWDIARLGIDKVVETVVEARITSLSIATTYHSGQILSLANGDPQLFSSGSGPLFDFRKSSWTLGPIKISPIMLFRELGNALAHAGISLRGWTIIGHDQQGLAPVINAWGQPIAHSACPLANQDAIFQMIDQLGDVGVFSTLDLEAIGYTPLFHGGHHEISGVVITPLLNFLLSMCFCPSCEAWFGEIMDWPGFRKMVQQDINQLLDSESSDELMQYLRERLQVAQFIQRRADAVESIVNRAFSTQHMGMAVIAHSFGRSARLSWLEGIPTSPTLHGDIISLGYGEPVQIQDDIQWLLQKGWRVERIIVGQTLVANAVPTLDDAEQRLAAALDMGITRFSFYNLGLLNTRRLEWLKHLAATIWT
ncbi:MAG: hypothetical protein C7B46_04575 [Sulfobacillus benefaciens]|uniref:Uncharacterized protein n=1 Tax=Sulfobacillus benefaciens TaxID=453960 RepID=A0A2T2XJP9_9FIRM|nr:MAG: hypothetical protein C7B46_04575 [Sulfobacillus benefaciens]